jgi:hypothetical protein
MADKGDLDFAHFDDGRFGPNRDFFDVSWSRTKAADGTVTIELIENKKSLLRVTGTEGGKVTELVIDGILADINKETVAVSSKALFNAQRDMYHLNVLGRALLGGRCRTDFLKESMSIPNG